MNETQTSSKNLDPSAQEFHPTFLHTPPPLFLHSPPPLTIFFPAPPLPPPPQILIPVFPPPPLTLIFPPTNHTTPPPLPTTTNFPSRSLLLSSIPPYATTHSVEAQLNTFGEIRAVEMDRFYNEGLVTVHFYDLRDAINALRVIRRQHFDGCPVWAQYIIPPNVLECVHDGYNHGTIVVFNLDSRVPDHYLKRIFDAFGQVKEVRNTPSKQSQKFVEFYDVRDAEKAANEMNGKIIRGRKITINFSRPGGNERRWCRTDSYSSFQDSKHGQPNSPQRPKPPRNICRRITQSVPPPSTNAGGSNANSNIVKTVKDSNASWKSSEHGQKNVGGGRGLNDQWMKGKSRRMLLSRFTIKEDVIRECGDLRTTVMIKNIPNKYSQKLMLNLLDNHCAHCNDKIMQGRDEGCLSSYDFVYLPIDFKNKCNVGYGFVNMTSPEATVRLYKAFHRLSWEVFNSRKICEVTYARVQGLEALKEHFRKTKFPLASDDIYPVVFEPPRDGRGELTPPQPIYGIIGSSDNGTISCSCSGSNTGSEADGVEEELLELRVKDDVTEVGETH